ncbi:unnamed protein product [Somion occarium]|uniref:Uncharacterized protein n=1 Tax=Somion occarium TaxID=3059160 RepID=A0ABP1CYD9_9APHY
MFLPVDDRHLPGLEAVAEMNVVCRWGTNASCELILRAPSRCSPVLTAHGRALSQGDIVLANLARVCPLSGICRLSLTSYAFSR